MELEEGRELLRGIQNIALWTMGEERTREELDEALSLIESICRHGAPVWSADEAERYSIKD